MIRAHIKSFQELFNFFSSYKALEENNLDVEVYMEIPELPSVSRSLVLKVGRAFEDWVSHHLDLNDIDGEPYLNITFSFPDKSIERNPSRKMNNVESIIVQDLRAKTEQVFEHKKIVISKFE
jgi:hypothetical protein